MRQRLWSELCQAKFNCEYYDLIICRNRKTVNAFNIIIAVFSSAGIMGYGFWKTIPLVACAIVAAISLLRLLQPHLLSSDKQIEKLEKAQLFYLDYHLKLERMYYDHTDQRIDDKELLEQFQNLKSTESSIVTMINEVHKYQSKRLTQKAKLLSDNFIITSYN